MNVSTGPIATTTALSFVLHGVVVTVILLLLGGPTPLVEGVGQGLDIHLISSDEVANNQEWDSPVKSQLIEKPAETRKEVLQNALVVQNSRQTILISDTVQEDTVERLQTFKPVQLDRQEDVTQYNQATDASKQQHSIIELLHSRISDEKEYPYIARRQRREGVATVVFVLHPDGKIENARLVHSSRTLALDRAALLAVQNIEPFSVAQDYLKQSEKFQVDVVFKLL